MARVSKDGGPRRPRATTAEGRENQLIAMAEDLAEKQLEAGTASSQVITHYLKLASSRERLEQTRIEQDIALTAAKTAALASAQRIEETYTKALDAMRAYSGQEPRNDFDD